MKRVLFFSPVGDFRGGAERSLFDLLGNRAIAPVLIVPEEGPLSAAAARLGIPVEVLPLGAVGDIRRPLRPAVILKAMADWFGCARALNAIAARRGADIVHSNGMKAHAITVLARALGGRPAVTHIRDIAVQGRERLAWKLIARFSDLMVLVSRPCWPGAGVLPRGVEVLHNGLDMTALPALAPRDPGAPLTLGFCGRFHPFKGIDTLLRWCAQARDAGLDFRLVIRGEAAPDDVAYERFLHEEVARLDLGALVRFDGKREGLAQIYEGLDVVVVPSVTPDPLPRSVMEAMGLGLPVIGYPAGGIPDMIDDGVNGWLIADGEAFTGVLGRLTGDPAARRDFGAKAQDKIRAGFSLEHLHRRMVDLYSGLPDR